MKADAAEIVTVVHAELWTLNAVRVPGGVDEAAVRAHLLQKFNIELARGWARSPAECGGSA